MSLPSAVRSSSTSVVNRVARNIVGNAVRSDFGRTNAAGDMASRATHGLVIMLCVFKAFAKRHARVVLALCLVGCSVMWASISSAEQASGPVKMFGIEEKARLTTSQIINTFSNVIDFGDVQSQQGISAETHWYADGRFVSRWWRESGGESGAVTGRISGRWKAERDLRCVMFGEDNQADWSCGEVWSLNDGRYLSLNPQGTAHGLHQLSPLK